MNANPLPARQPRGFKGVMQILAFNWTFYAFGALLIVILLALHRRLVIYPVARGALYSAVALTAFWMLASVLVSHYVYDRSRLYRWDWIAELFAKRPGHWVNIHAGLDQTTNALEQLFPDPDRRVFDMYNPLSMTEASIKRARRRGGVTQRTEEIDAASLPLSDSECDAAFLIFAAHELREREDRRKLFRELNRSLKADGQVIVVEHMRDWANFLAYGPGAFHFHSRKEWLASWQAIGLVTHEEISITPFVRCFVLKAIDTNSTRQS